MQQELLDLRVHKVRLALKVQRDPRVQLERREVKGQLVAAAPKVTLAPKVPLAHKEQQVLRALKAVLDLRVRQDLRVRPVPKALRDLKET